MIDLNDPDRQAVYRATSDARGQLTAARALLMKNGFVPDRVDRLAGPDGTSVQTGYTCGESRLTVRTRKGVVVGEFRLNGRNPYRFDQFKQLVGI